MPEVCVTIARSRHRKVISELDACAKAGVKLVELRIDFIRHEPRFDEILAHKPCPMIATARRQRDGGMWGGDEDRRLRLLRTAVASGFDYVDLEGDIAKQVPRFGNTKRIVSFHDMDGMPEDLDGLHAELAACDPDIVKIATKAGSVLDNFRLLDLVRRARVPTLAIGMGEFGMPSRVLGGVFGSPFTFAAFNEARIVAPGMLTYTELMRTYRYDALGPDTQIYAVIGDPIEQSLSPLVHNDAFRKRKLDKVYVPFRVPAHELKAFVEQARTVPIRGLSVTIPHKEAILPLGKVDDPLVAATDSANTMVWDDEHSEYRLLNTDGPAAIDALLAIVKSKAGWMQLGQEDGHGPTEEQPLKDRTVLVLGAGGVARTLAYTLQSAGGLVAIAARKLDRAKEVARVVGCQAIDWSLRHARRSDIVVNCTPLGMYPKELHSIPIHPSAIREGSVVFDTVYNPEQTRLLQEAKLRQAHVVTGVEMFVGQAERQFRLFTGLDAPSGRMATLVREAMSPARRMLREHRHMQEKAMAARGESNASAEPPSSNGNRQGSQVDTEGDGHPSDAPSRLVGPSAPGESKP